MCAFFLAFVYEIGNVPRVDGQLAMTRAFGDAELKEHISVPDIKIESIDENTEFIILASDGLWKMIYQSYVYYVWEHK